MVSNIKNTVMKFDFKGRSGSIMFWKYIPVRNGWYLTVVDQPFRSSQNEKAFEDYRKWCLGHHNILIGLETKVQHDWFAGLASQTKIADQRTKHDRDQFFGQLVMPVFCKADANETFLGVIELVTMRRKGSYETDYKQIYKLLKDEKLTTKPMAKMIKVKYMDDIVKFPLPLSSGIAYLWEKVTERFNTVDQRTFRIKYDDHKGNILPVVSDGDLQACIANSSSMGMMTIRMIISK